MALVIKHTKVSTIPDGSDPSLVLPSDWNANHALTGVADVAQGGTGLSAVGPAGTVLTSNGTSMGWQPAGGAGTVTSVALSGGTTGLTVSGSPITSSGTMTLAGTLAVANGGTGQTTTGNVGQALISNGSGSSSWGTPGLASKAYDLMGGTANQILFQNALDSTHYIDAPTTGGTVLGWNGTSFAWVVNGGGGSTLTGETQSTTPFKTALGASALTTSTGVNNTAVGYQAGNLVSSGNNNTFMGFQCGDAITSGIGNTALGANTFGAASTAQYSIAIGLNAANAGNGSNNIVIGANAGANAATNSNIFLGTNAGNSPAAASAGECIGIGSNALSSQNSGVGSVAIGVESCSNLGAGGNIVAVGYYAGNALTNGNGATFVGFNAGKAVTTANYNTMVGSNAGAVTTTGANNTFMGSNSGTTNINGANNTYLGFEAGKLNTNSLNTFVGAKAGGSGTGGSNTIIGACVTPVLTTAFGNTLIGVGAGSNISTGNNNTVIGNFTMPAGSSSNYVILADGVGDLAVMYNDAGAMSFDGINFGNQNEILRSNGTSLQPTWVNPNVGAIRNATVDNGINPADTVTFANCATGSVTLTLPAAASNAGLILTVKRIDSNSANSLTIASAGGTIEGNATSVIGIGIGVVYCSDGTNWWELSNS